MEPKMVKIPVWDVEADEIIEMEIEEEALKEMDRAQEECEKRQEEARRRDRQAIRYVRG